MSSRTIHFHNLSITPEKIEVEADFDDQSHPLFFSFSEPIETDEDHIALTLATLCGQKYDKIRLDFPIRAEILKTIETETNAEVEAEINENPAQLSSGGGHILSFSGGFDSIAAKLVLPRSTHLVSLDFGGWFQREAEFFEKFDPLIIKTNIRRVPDQSTSLARNSWLFMGVGALLTSHHFKARFHTFGSILGEKLANPAPQSTTPALLRAAGLTEIGATAGVTEIGTTRMVVENRPDLVKESLTSLAGKKDRKNYYKGALVTLVADELGMENPLGSFKENWDHPVPFTDSYTTALSALYFISRGREDLISPLFTEIPEESRKFATTLSLDFFNKVDPDFYQDMPSEQRIQAFSSLDRLGYKLFNESDWLEVIQVREHLNSVFDLSQSPVRTQTPSAVSTHRNTKDTTEMTDYALGQSYAPIKEFIRTQIVDRKLSFNSLKTTTSAIKRMTDRFEANGWVVRDTTTEESKHPRHEITSPDGSITLKMNSAKVFRHPMHTEQICQRKNLTKKMLEFDGVPVPRGAEFSIRDRGPAAALFSKMQKPVVIKPSNSGGSRGVTVDAFTLGDFQTAWKTAADEAGDHGTVLLEEFVRGVELRALVVGDRVISIVARIQAYVVGDAHSTLRQLIDKMNEERSVHYRSTQLEVEIDWSFIQRQGLVEESVPGENQIVLLNAFGLPAAGALLVDVSRSVDPAILKVAVQAADAIPDLETGGVDLLVDNVVNPGSIVVLEVNTAPSLNIHRYVTHGPVREVTDDIVDHFLGEIA